MRKLFIPLLLFSTLEANQKNGFFIEAGFETGLLEGTHKALEKAGVKALKVLKISEGRPNIMDVMRKGEISMAIKTSDHKSQDDAKLHRAYVRKNH
ncbi:hypothetical protein AEY54_04320, partial [Helicobacter pylori]